MTHTPPDAERADGVKIAAYYFPGFHADPRTDEWHGTGWTEWELLRAAKPRFEGHRQPRQPARGAFDESDPDWAQEQAKLALEHGVDAFIFDWYWYQNQDFLNAALDRGFLNAPGPRPEFALMWANHDWMNIHPASSAHKPQVLLRGRISDYEFDSMVDTIVTRYLTRDDYLKVGGLPYFSVYEPGTLAEGLGSWSAAARAIDRLRARAQSAGLGDVHLNLVMADRGVLPGERPDSYDAVKAIRELDAASATSYVWIHHYDPGTHGFPSGAYHEALNANRAVWRRFSATLPVPYFPNVTVGWDSTPRTIQTDTFDARGYPWLSVLDSAPHEFEGAMTEALQFAAAAGSELVTVNAWNEWTEGSYLLPDDVHGDAFLKACLRAVSRHARSGASRGNLIGGSA